MSFISMSKKIKAMNSKKTIWNVIIWLSSTLPDRGGGGIQFKKIWLKPKMLLADFLRQMRRETL